ncbi:MAG TPA: hypothetical protein PKZ15_06325, partial [Paludibacteraceae bacterium]|nr:hypothetical protein [Paludibacteraceae bacterium]
MKNYMKYNTMLRIRYTILLFLFTVLGVSYAQAGAVYPIQLTSQLLPPYGNCISDYVVKGFERLKLNALQRDLHRPSYDFIVRMTIKQGSTIYIQSSAEYNIRAGVITMLPVSNLFNDRMEDLQASSKYKENGFCLPEGAYEFRFQAFDKYNKNTPVSEPVYIYTYLGMMEPPMCIAPADNGCVDYTTNTLAFSWMDRVISMPSNDKRYCLEIYEMPENFDPSMDDAKGTAMSQEPIFTKKDIPGQMNTVFVPQQAGLFIKGRTYVWRVRVYNGNTSWDKEAKSLHAKNNGYSQFSSFIFKKCVDQDEVWKEPKKLNFNYELKPIKKHVDTTSATVKAVWYNNEVFTCGYIVEYNTIDTLGPWSKIRTEANDTDLVIPNVARGVDYVVRVQGLVCPDENSTDTVYSAYSDTMMFKLDKLKDVECGSQLPGLNSYKSLGVAMPSGTTLSADGYNIKVLSCTMNVLGSDTTFTGTGLVSIPLLKNIVSLTVKFDKVKINEKSELMKGMVYANSDLDNSMDLNLNGLANKNFAGSGPAQLQKDKLPTELPVAEIPKESIALVDGVLVVKDSNGDTTSIGKLATKEPESCQPQGSYMDDDIAEIVFDPIAENTPFDRGIDEFTQSIKISEYYETRGKTYKIPWTAVPEGNTLNIKATLNNISNAIIPDKHVYFIACSEGEKVQLKATYDGNNTFTVPVFGGAAGRRWDIYAMADTANKEKGVVSDCSKLFTLGCVKVLSMKKETFKLHLVPVRRDINDIDKNAIQQKLDEFYLPYGKKFVVIVENRFGDGESFDFVKDGLTVEGSGLMSTETKEMSLLKYLYKESVGFVKDEPYLFVLPKSPTNNITGDMPRCKPVGYVFASDATYKDGWTVAHELGHGVFTFDHAFKFCSNCENTTDNLMAYNAGNSLKVWQWNVMDNRSERVFSFLEADEDAMAKTIVDESFDVDVRFNYCVNDIFQKQVEQGFNLVYYLNNKKEALNTGVSDGLGNSTDEKSFTIKYIPGNISFNAEESPESIILSSLNYSVSESYLKIKSFNTNGPDIVSSIENSEEQKFVLYLDNDGKMQVCTIISTQDKNNLPKAQIEGILMESVRNCYNISNNNGTSITDLSLVKQLLIDFNKQKRANQKVQFHANGKNYELEGDELKESSLTDQDIENGKFDNADVLTRLEFDKDGVIQIRNLGINQSISAFDGKSVDKKELQNEIKEATNRLFKDNNVKDATLTLSQSNDNENLMRSDGFLFGESMVIEDSPFYKLYSEGLGVAMTFLKEGEIEAQIYYKETDKIPDKYKNNGHSIIHAPSAMTGYVEGGASSLTDVTGFVAMGYNLVVDPKARNDMKEGMKSMVNSVADDPSQAFPILKELASQSIAGISVEDWHTIDAEDSDKGAKRHLVVKASINTTLNVLETVFSGGTSTAAKVAAKTTTVTGKTALNMDFIKVLRNIPKSLDKNAFLKKVSKLPDGGEEFLKEFSGITDKQWEKIISKTDFVDNWQKTKKWEFPADRDLFVEYYEVYTNPKFYDIITGVAKYPGNLGFSKLTDVKRFKRGASQTIEFDRYGGVNGSFLGRSKDSWE